MKLPYYLLTVGFAILCVSCSSSSVTPAKPQALGIDAGIIDRVPGGTLIRLEQSTGNIKEVQIRYTSPNSRAGFTLAKSSELDAFVRRVCLKGGNEKSDQRADDAIAEIQYLRKPTTGAPKQVHVNGSFVKEMCSKAP